jgi:ABC-type glutathione transport system ATPase component
MTAAEPMVQRPAERSQAALLLRVHLSAFYSGKEVLRGFALELREGEITGLAGQSGSGKSTLALALLGLLKYKGGTAQGFIGLRGRDLLTCSEREMRAIRGKEIGLVLQNAASSLNPVLSLETQFKEAWRAHSREPWDSARKWVRSVLAGVDLPGDDAFLRRLPRQLSAGQAQRVLIAMAILHRPFLLVADEPTSALDPITQRDVLRLLERLNREMGTAILCISHDLLALASFCHQVAILREGSVVDYGPPADVFKHPSCPYTRQLVDALPRPDRLFSFPVGRNIS